MKLKKSKWPSPMDVARKTIESIGKVVENKETLRQFDELQYENLICSNGLASELLRWHC